MMQLLCHLSGGSILVQLLFDLSEVSLHELIELSEGCGFVELIFMFLRLFLQEFLEF